MVIVNKILNVLIFLLAIAACIAAVLLHQRRLELRSRADFMAATMVKVADAIDGGEGTTTDINSKDVITEEYLGWERYHKTRKWDEGTQKYIFTDWEDEVNKLPGFTKKLQDLKEKMATKFDEVRAAAKFDLASMKSADDTPVVDEDGNPFTPELYKEALNSILTFETMVELLPAKIERIGSRGVLLGQKIESITKALKKPKSADNFDVYSDKDNPKNEELGRIADEIASDANKLYGRAQALASHYKTILQGFDPDPNEDIPRYFQPTFNPEDMFSENLETLNTAANTLSADFRGVNKKLHELAIKTKQLDKALVDIERQNKTIEDLNKENDDLKNKNGALVAENKRVSKKLEELKELYGTERNVMRPGFAAKVVEANERFDFIVLNKGRKDGIKNNVEMVVHNNGKYICKVLITKVLETSCVCDILPVTRPKDAQGNFILPSKGDEAVVPGIN